MTFPDLADQADRHARDYLDTIRDRRVFPDAAALEGLARFDEPVPERGRAGAETLALLHDRGSPATVASNGPDYYGFVIGGTLPEVLAVERLTAAWDQCASSEINSPTAHRIETVAARWTLAMLGLPGESAVTFGTSATSCGLACLTAARRALLARQGWDFDAQGLIGAPEIRVMVSDTVHVSLLKVLRILGFGTERILRAPVDPHGRIDPDQLPPLDDRTILCLQAGEVNTGEFDPFGPLIARARATGAWVHVDGAFGLWARASAALAHLAEGVEGADSWTVDGHKWLNTPYDGAVGICRDAGALAAAMNSDAAYSVASAESQKNLGLEFSRRARGVPIWVALRSLGREGVAELIDRNCRHARRLAKGLEAAGATVLNRVILNQVLFRLDTDEATERLREAAIVSGRLWFGPTVWDGRAACRMSVSHWQSSDESINRAIAELTRAIRSLGAETTS